MKAAVYYENGDPSVLKYEDVPDPECHPKGIVIRVEPTSSVTRVGVAMPVVSPNDSPSAPSGAYGILISTWRSFGLSGWPYQAPASVQDNVALELYARYGFHPWSSRFACGL